MQTYDLNVNMTFAFVNNPTAWVLILLVIVLFFGGKNIPELMKGLGQGMREFKKGMENDEAPHPAEAEREAEIEREVRRRLEAQRRLKHSSQQEDKSHEEKYH
jgi:sec-independent protein translocase protein TatA